MNAKWLLLFLFLVVLTLFGWFFRSENRMDSSVKPETPSPPLQASEEIKETRPSRDSITVLDEEDREPFVIVNGRKRRLTLAILSKDAMQKIVEVANSKDNEQFPLEGEAIPEINSLQDAYTHFSSRISFASTPRTFFTKNGDYYFSGGGGTKDVSDFSEGFLVTKDGQIRAW
jgi:hypothetical protein